MKKESKSILISIRPEFIKMMHEGDKFFEYRKYIPENTKQIIIYATVPIKGIVGIVQIKKIYCEKPRTLWRKTKDGAGISYEFFLEYFSGKDIGYALEIGNTRWFTKPIPLKKIKKDLKPPQSFFYIDDCIVNKIERFDVSSNRIVS
jgi:predicted transcriptional regulator